MTLHRYATEYVDNHDDTGVNDAYEYAQELAEFGFDEEDAR